MMSASTQFLSLFTEDGGGNDIDKLNAAYRKRAENLAYSKQMGQISAEEFEAQREENDATYKQQVAQVRSRE